MLPAPFNRLRPMDVTTRVLRSGDTLFRQGDAVRAIIHIRQGRIHLVRHTESGREVPIFQAGANDTLAEAALFSDRYHCDATAAIESEVHIIKKHAILDAMRQDPTFGIDLVRRLSGQVQSYRRRLELLAIGSAEGRVLAALADGRLRGTVMEFAAEIGLSHEATYRALSALVRAGRAEKTGRGRYRAISDQF